MARNDMRMRIHIDGDNRGFKQALNQSKRDMQGFQKESGVGFGGVLAATSIGRQLGAAGDRLQQAIGSMFLNKRFNTRMEKFIHHNDMIGAGSRMMSNAMDRGDLGRAQRIQKQLRHNKRGAAIAKRQAQTLNMVNDFIPYVGTILKSGAMGAAVAAAAVTAIQKLSSDNRKHLADAGQFSGGVMRHQAMADVHEVRKQLEVSQSGFLMEQQRRLIDSQFNRKHAGGVGLGYVTTEMEIVWNDFIGWLKETTASAMTADHIQVNGVAY